MLARISPEVNVILLLLPTRIGAICVGTLTHLPPKLKLNKYQAEQRKAAHGKTNQKHT